MSGDQTLPQHANRLIPVLVWDLPVRIVHWLIVLLVTLSWMTAKNNWFVWHKLSGYAILSLILFRIYWGFSGSSTARFAHFLRGPKMVGRHVRTLFTRDRRHVYRGHNPLGGWNVIVLLFVMLLQAGLGFFAVEVDGLESGPLATYVSFEMGRQVAALHGSVFNFLLVLIGLHIAAVLAHIVYQRENLIAPMLTGIKRVPRAHVQILDYVAPWRALVGLVIAILLVLGLAFGL